MATDMVNHSSGVGQTSEIYSLHFNLSQWQKFWKLLIVLSDGGIVVYFGEKDRAGRQYQRLSPRISRKMDSSIPRSDLGLESSYDQQNE